jgi:hypothetical protein
VLLKNPACCKRAEPRVGKETKNISRNGPRNCRSLHGTPGQVDCARDDKGESGASIRFRIVAGELQTVHPLGPTKRMKNALGSATALYGSVVFSFVIPRVCDFFDLFVFSA